MLVLLTFLGSLIACAPAEAAEEGEAAGAGGVQVYDYDCDGGGVAATLPANDVIYMVEHCVPDGRCKNHAQEGDGRMSRDNLELSIPCGTAWPDGNEAYVRLTVIQ